MNNTIRVPAEPTAVGQTVKATSYGGNVSMEYVGRTGTVQRFTNRGNPVVRVLLRGEIIDVTDSYGCFKLVDTAGAVKWTDAPVVR